MESALETSPEQASVPDVGNAIQLNLLPSVTVFAADTKASLAICLVQRLSRSAILYLAGLGL